MLGQHPKQKIMNTRTKKLMTVKNRLVQDRSRVKVKVIERTRRKKKEAAKKKKRQAKEQAARLAWLAASNAVQATTAEAATNTATAGAPNPVSTNVQAANETKDATTSARRRSPGRLHICHARKATTRRPPGTGALSEIRHYQRVGGLLVQKLPFQRLCNEIMDRIVYDTRDSTKQIPTRFQTSTIMAMQETGEAHLVGLFEDVNLLAIHCKRVTILTRYLALVR
jgi:histone H3